MRGTQQGSRGRVGKLTNRGGHRHQQQPSRWSKNLPNGGHKGGGDRNHPRRESKRLQDQLKINPGSRREEHRDRNRNSRGVGTKPPQLCNGQNTPNSQHKRPKLQYGDIEIPDADSFAPRAPRVASLNGLQSEHPQAGFAAYLKKLQRPDRREQPTVGFANRSQGTVLENVFHRQSNQRSWESFHSYSPGEVPDPEHLADAQEPDRYSVSNDTQTVQLNHQTTAKNKPTGHTSPPLTPATPTTIKFRRIPSLVGSSTEHLVHSSYRRAVSLRRVQLGS
jgi:hypothetical protein